MTYLCLFVSALGMVFVCSHACGCTCVSGHMGVRLYRRVVCTWRLELYIKHLLLSLSTVDVHSASDPTALPPAHQEP